MAKLRAIGIFALLLVLVVTWEAVTRPPSWQKSAIATQERDTKVPPLNDQPQKASGDNESQPPKKQRAEEVAPSLKSASQLRTEARKLIYKSEAERAQMLVEQKTSGATIYMLGVTRPTPEQVKALRVAMGRMRRELSSSETDKEEFDKWLSTMIDRDDPFGTQGDKIIMIFVPDKPDVALTGMIYPTDDFKKEAAWLNARPARIQKESATGFYQNDDGELERFAELIVK